ncbi:hypothetical protein CROQUDRAFT_674255 [Cronartium quercuum f. sp. fusiforme G11]|uniref:Retrotransposon gag domain-containing protein n=1 Tax=Cronartium quercuum f. sp. fusiforme G11 TaxID=708437 RepID=A0A9P6N7D6_9BASI|nr:hypothetical protein CROQUDRAFT_674255 [Cronartium quercuum f. sp. fusiforme G11]
MVIRGSVLPTPVAIEIDDDDGDEGDSNDPSARLITDVVTAGKLIKQANIKPFTGAASQNATEYIYDLDFQFDFLFLSPTIRLQLAFGLMKGSAYVALESAIRAGNRPKTVKHLVFLMKSRFPSTTNKLSVDKRHNLLNQKVGESLLSYWTRFQNFMVDAREVGYQYDPALSLVKMQPNDTPISEIVWWHMLLSQIVPVVRVFL